MKKNLLLGSAFLLTLSAFPQINRSNIKPAGIIDMSERLAQKFALEPASDQSGAARLNSVPTDNLYQPENNPQLSSAPPSSINWALLCGSMNVYGQLVSNSKPLQYNANVNGVSFIYRKSATYNETPALPPASKAGVIVAQISTNWGAAWDSTCLWSNDPNAGRYPQGAIYSAPGNSNIANAYVVGSGPTVGGGLFTGVWYASKQLGVQGSAVYNTTASAAPGAQQFLSTSSPTYAPNLCKHGWSRYGFSSTDDGIVRSLGLIQNDQNTLDPRGVAVVKGTFNAGAFTWTTDSFIPPAIIKTGGARVLSSDVQMAWNKAGTVGYVVMIGAKSTATLSNKGYQPIIYKTSNSGVSWSSIAGIDFNSPAMAPVTNNFAGVITGNDTIGLPYFNNFDIVVDTNNFLHIGAIVNSGAIAHNDSLNYIAQYTMSINPGSNYLWAHRPGSRPYVYDFIGDGTSPFIYKIVDSLATEDPGAGTTASGYNDNPWDNTGTGGAKVNIDPRLQLGRTPNGNYLTFSFTESDTNFTNQQKKWNILPNIKTRCMRVNGADAGNMYKVSPVEINVSKPAIGQGSINPNVASRSTLHYMSPTTGTATILSSPLTLTVDINTPFTVTNSNPFSQLTNNTTWYTTAKLSYSFNTTIVAVEENSANSASSSILFPNPAANNATLLLDLKENSDVTVNVYSIVGQLVKSIEAQGKPGENNLNIDLANLSSGVYMVKVNVGNATSTKKLIIE